MDIRSDDVVRAAVREQYGKVARGERTGCAPGCCVRSDATASAKLGYSEQEMDSVPEGANMGLGCGNPGAVAALKVGQKVLDLGSGGGFDCFLAARRVGPSGAVVGVDMTPEMITKARANAHTLGIDHVEFRLGEIEHLPVADQTIDVILSNCVVNLSPDKGAVFHEAFRVLKTGGRLAISDVVRIGEPTEIEHDVALLTGCVSGAVSEARVRELLAAAGFVDIDVKISPESREFIGDWFPDSTCAPQVAAATISAMKPTARACCGPECCAPAATGTRTDGTRSEK